MYQAFRSDRCGSALADWQDQPYRSRFRYFVLTILRSRWHFRTGQSPMHAGKLVLAIFPLVTSDNDSRTPCERSRARRSGAPLLPIPVFPSCCALVLFLSPRLLGNLPHGKAFIERKLKSLSLRRVRRRQRLMRKLRKNSWFAYRTRGFTWGSNLKKKIHESRGTFWTCQRQRPVACVAPQAGGLHKSLVPPIDKSEITTREGRVRCSPQLLLLVVRKRPKVLGFENFDPQFQR